MNLLIVISSPDTCRLPAVEAGRAALESTGKQLSAILSTFYSYIYYSIKNWFQFIDKQILKITLALKNSYIVLG